MNVAEEYLTIKETAALLKVSAKRVRNLMCAGAFKQGEHFFRPPGLGARFKRSALLAWIESKEEKDSDTIHLKKGLVLRIPHGMRSNS
jgi:Helix-turn-helix domain